MTTLECVLAHSIIFLSYILHARAVALREFRGILNPHKFSSPVKFEKIYNKCIPLCSYICLKLSFKASENLKGLYI